MKYLKYFKFEVFEIRNKFFKSVIIRYFVILKMLFFINEENILDSFLVMSFDFFINNMMWTSKNKLTNETE